MMPRFTLLLAFFSLIASPTVAQFIDEDGNYFEESPTYSSEVFYHTRSGGSCPPPVINDTTVCGAGFHDLYVSGGLQQFRWFDDPVGGTLLHNGPIFSSNITTSTTFWIDAICGDTTFAIPPHNNIYTGNTRGYWFVAPADFIISGLRVPTEASTGPQSVEVLRFNTQPTVYPTLTNDFVSLGYWPSVSGTAVIPASIQVFQDDTIGILGSRGGMNSYTASGTHFTNMGGFTVELKRLGFQDELANVQANGVFTSVSGALSRVEVYIGAAADTSARLPMDVTLAEHTGSVQNEFICYGDTFSVGGIHYTMTGNYTDTIMNVAGCDSTVTLALTVDQELFPQTLYDVNGNLQVANPVLGVTYQWIDCNGNVPVPGETGLTFIPFVNGNYALQVISAAGCSVIGDCKSVNNVGIDEISILQDMNAYPNPTNGMIIIDLGLGLTDVQLEVMDALGRLVMIENPMGKERIIELEMPESSGIYHIRVHADGYIGHLRIVKE